MTTTRPAVSIGLPVYNGERYVARAIESVLAQDFPDFELIICDNDSYDATVDICSSYADQDARIQLHRNNRNIGLAGNFNRTFALARGSYFKWVAHDDWHAPTSLRLTVELMEEHPEAVLCATGVSLVDEHGNEFDRWVPRVDLRDPRPHIRMHRLLTTLGETHPMYGLIRSSALQQTDLIQGYVGSDRTLLSALVLLGPMVQVPEILHFYTVSATARRGYRPALHYDPANRDKLPLRTWRLLYKHLGIVQRSNLSIREKALLTGSVLNRFGVRDFRRLAAETYYSARIMARRATRSRTAA